MEVTVLIALNLREDKLRNDLEFASKCLAYAKKQANKGKHGRIYRDIDIPAFTAWIEQITVELAELECIWSA